ncbi:MAG: hypothetical protein RRY62_13840 [Chryseobacterium sp.]
MKERDELIINYLCQGLQVKDIPISLFKEHGISVSISTIEKRLNLLRKQFEAKTLLQLAIILRNRKII